LSAADIFHLHLYLRCANVHKNLSCCQVRQLKVLQDFAEKGFYVILPPVNYIIMSEMKKILVTYDMFHEGFAELEKRYEVLFPSKGRNFTREEVLERIPEYDVLCSMFDFPVNRELIDRGAKLQLIANYAVGYNNIDVAYALSKGLTVANTPGPVTAPTANLALALIIDTARRVTECDRKLRACGRAMRVGVLENLGVPVTGRTLGIIGMGRIGKALAKRANACGMYVIYHNRHPLDREEETRFNAVYVSKEELLAQSDFVSLNAPYTPETHHLIGADELKRMKPSAILINTARGPLVDEAALIKALQEKTIHGAGLDVFEHGGYPSPELLKMDNVVLTPHIGTQTLETRLMMVQAVCDNVIGFLEGDRPVSRVTRP
jgi:lactate dehydrogenase-like 2-hydroxyacid dehydrogenase